MVSSFQWKGECWGCNDSTCSGHSGARHDVDLSLIPSLPHGSGLSSEVVGWVNMNGLGVSMVVGSSMVVV